MAKCAYCGSTILFTSRRAGEQWFCNDFCLERGNLLAMSPPIPDNVVEQSVWSIHQGPCPKCRGPGPVDVYVSYRVWSAFYFTTWKSQPQISCRACGVKSQIGGAVFSLFCGWWGFPWGPIMTPVQITRDIIGSARAPDPTRPSTQLTRIVRLNIAARALASQSAGQDV